MTKTKAIDVVLVVSSLFIVTVIYKYYQTVVYKDKDPNFIWNATFQGKIEVYPQTTESQKWAFFCLSTVNLLVCYLIVTTIIILSSWIKEAP